MKNSFIISLLLFGILLPIKKTNCNLFKNILNLFKGKEEDNFLNIFIVTHKDFQNYRYNPVYKIIATDPSQLINKYDLEVMYVDQNYKIKDIERGYAEMYKIYHVYNLYKKGKMSSKYIGLNHYRRYFPFLDNIPNLDEIFKNYDIIVGCLAKIPGDTLRNYYCKNHICKNFDEILEIIKEIKPEYYKDAVEVANNNIFYGNNIFIMKKKDFLNYCEFMFDILFEFDKRNNFNNMDDIKNYISKQLGSFHNYQIRIQGFLSERIATIFYH